MREISESEMLQICESDNQSETIWIEYKNYIKKICCLWMRPKKWMKLWLKAWKADETVTKIHEWIITTVNGDILSVEDICAKELDIAEMTAQFNKVTGLIAIE